MDSYAWQAGDVWLGVRLHKILWGSLQSNGQICKPYGLFFRCCLDKFHNIVHGFHELDLSVGDFDIELVLKFSDEADHVV